MSRRVIMGKWPPGVGSGFGLRVAQPGKDAASLDDRDLTFNSDWPAILPLVQYGTFGISPGQAFSIATPDLGYIPLCFFAVSADAPFGSPAYVPIIPPGWGAYQNVNYDGGPSFLKLLAARGQLLAQYQLYAPNNNSQGWPGSFQVAYAVYRSPAG